MKSYLGFVFGVLAACASLEAVTCSTILARLGLEPSDFAYTEVVRARNAKLIQLNKDAWLRDFPEFSSYPDNDIRQFIESSYGYVTQFTNDTQGTHHSGVAVDESDRDHVVVPHTYGRAFIRETENPTTLVDVKGAGVTYVTKEGGQVVIRPNPGIFVRGKDHQNGVATLREAVVELLAGEILSKVAVPGGGANRVYFILDLGSDLVHYDGEGNETHREPLVLIGRQLNNRLYRIDNKLDARKKFLSMNSRLFWSGIYHASMNRYNADNGIYIDYGTFTGVPDHAYRVTTMAAVPYGLSDFYGLFGEWSAGQIEKGAESSPFVGNSTGVLLANIASAANLSVDDIWNFAHSADQLEGPQVHEWLLRINKEQPEKYRHDPTEQTFTKLDLFTLDESGTTGAERLAERLDSRLLYERLLVESLKDDTDSGSFVSYLFQATVEADSADLHAFADYLASVSDLLRHGLSYEQRHHALDFVRRARSTGSVFERKRIMAEARQLQELYQATKDNELVRYHLERNLLRYQESEFHGDSAQKKAFKLASQFKAPSYLLRLQAGNADRDLVWVAPTIAFLHTPEYQTWMNQTVGILWRDTRAAGEQFGHSYIRVGDQIYDLQVDKIFKDDFVRMMNNRFFYDFGMAGRSGKAPYHEVVFELSAEVLAEMKRYFADREQGRATVNGELTVPYFDVAGVGDIWDGHVKENCGAFATSFNHERWWNDYPLLKQASEQTGVSFRMNGATVALQLLYNMSSRPSAVVSWGGSGFIQNPTSLHQVLEMTGEGFSVDTLRTWPLKQPAAQFTQQADQTKSWAVSKGLTGFQATAMSPASKGGDYQSQPRRFNFTHLSADQFDAFSDEYASDKLAFWWRWEPGGQFGHVWVSVGDTIYDQGMGDYQSLPLKQFFNEQKQNNYHFNGAPVFFAGLQLKLDHDEIARLREFFNRRQNADGHSLPRPGYIWDQPFIKDEITPERCGMYSTSFANPAWQAQFSDLRLGEIVEKYGLKYMDGSLFILHHLFYRANTLADFFIFGHESHVQKQNIYDWTLPVDPLPESVREPARGAWLISDKNQY